MVVVEVRGKHKTSFDVETRKLSRVRNASGPCRGEIVVGLLLLADLGLYSTKGCGASLLGEGALGKCEGTLHQLWELTWILLFLPQRIMFIHPESRN